MPVSADKFIILNFVIFLPHFSSILWPVMKKGGAHKPARQERQIQRHEFKTVARHVKNVPRHGISHVPAHRNNDHDDSGALVGGLILGVILGAAIADANANGN